MNKIELISMLRAMVKDELKELLKSKEGRAIVREMIGKEVRIEVDKLLTEMEQSSGEKEVIAETTQDVKLSKMVERGELPPKNVQKRQTQTAPLQLTKNPKYNDLLNETLNAIRSGKEALPSAEGTDGQLALLKEQYAGQPTDEMAAWPTMPTGGMNARTFGAMRPTPSADSTGKPVTAMLPDVDVNGNPLMVNPNALPDHVQKALTRNYSKVLKKIDEKRG